jgi:hypothetical protein
MELLTILSVYFKAIGQIFSATWWIVGPVVLFYLFQILWKKYAIGQYLSSLEYVLLEIKPSRELEKSPRVMEQIFAALHGSYSTPSLVDSHIKGRWGIQPFFSFEIHGANGEMHLCIRCEKKYRNFVESLIYAQYPEAEIEEIEDYVDKVPKNLPNSEWDLWGTDMRLVKDDGYPIRTYKYFQEEVTKGMIDPLASLADVISSLPPGQEIWIQIVVMPIDDRVWIKDTQKIIDKLAKREVKADPWLIIKFFKEVIDIFSYAIQYIFNPIETTLEMKKEERPLLWALTPLESETLKAVEESLSKRAFETKIRFLYIGKRDGFDRSFISGVMGSFSQFNDPNLNSLAPENSTKTYANYFYKAPRLLWSQRKIFARYLDRDTDGPIFVLNSEELATIFHMPDMSAASPAISRVAAKKAGPPINLPIE